jgi:hypothetical protein
MSMVKHCGFFDLAYVKYLICYGGLVFLCMDNHLTFCFTVEVGLKFLLGVRANAQKIGVLNLSSAAL